MHQVVHIIIDTLVPYADKWITENKDTNSYKKQYQFPITSWLSEKGWDKFKRDYLTINDKSLIEKFNGEPDHAIGIEDIKLDRVFNCFTFELKKNQKEDELQLFKYIQAFSEMLELEVYYGVLIGREDVVFLKYDKKTTFLSKSKCMEWNSQGIHPQNGLIFKYIIGLAKKKC